MTGRSLTLAHVENGYELTYIVGADNLAVDTQGGVGLGAEAEGVDGRLCVGELKSARLAEQQVVAQVLREVFVELDAFVEEWDALRASRSWPG